MKNLTVSSLKGEMVLNFRFSTVCATALVGAALAAQGELMPIPDGYTKVDYIQSTGAQYIDTGYVPNADTRIEAKFAIVEYSGDREYVFGTYNNINGGVGRMQFSYGFPSFLGYGNTYDNMHYWFDTDNAIHTVKVEKGVFTVDGVELEDFKKSWDGESESKSLYIFGLNSGSGPSSTQKPKERIYSFDIYDGDVLVHSYVPVKDDNGDGRFYDQVVGAMVETQYFSSDNQPPFIAGSESDDPGEDPGEDPGGGDEPRDFNFILTRSGNTATATDEDSGLVLNFTVVDADAHTLRFTGIKSNPNNVTVLDLTHFEEENGQVWNVVTVGSSACKDKSYLTELRLPSTLETVEGEAFWGCSGLTTVTPLLPEKLAKINIYAFANTAVTGNLVLASARLVNLGNNVFLNGRYSSVDLSKTSVTNLGEHVFADNPMLKKVVLPKTLEKVQQYAFYRTPNLEQIYFASDTVVPKIPQFAQSGIANSFQVRVYVPVGSTVLQTAIAGNWGAELTNEEKEAFQAAYPGERLPIGKIQFPKGGNDGKYQYLCTWNPEPTPPGRGIMLIFK